jgi:hypothetical protein
MAYINAQEVKAIRDELKREFPKFKFGVRKSPGGGHAVQVTVKQGPTDFSDIFTHGEGYAQINHHWLERTGEHQTFFEKIVNIMKTAPAKAGVGDMWFDESDSMTDYFHIAYYLQLNVGEWCTPYVQK